MAILVLSTRHVHRLEISQRKTEAEIVRYGSYVSMGHLLIPSQRVLAILSNSFVLCMPQLLHDNDGEGTAPPSRNVGKGSSGPWRIRPGLVKSKRINNVIVRPFYHCKLSNILVVGREVPGLEDETLRNGS